VPPSAPLADDELPRCRIVTLNWNGKRLLGPCFESLAALDYDRARLEVVMVDNGSDDGSVAWLRREHPETELLANPRNVGFAAGCNQGAHHGECPEIVVFLNNDLRVEPGFLRALLAPIVSGACQATTARMLDWEGRQLDSAGGGMNFHGFGIQRGYREPDGPEWDTPRLTLFACGGAMAMEARLFQELGGFDETFFAYYEDVDLGWRTWLAGHAIQYVPTAVCYHRHSSTSRTLPPERLRLLQVRNPLLACFKNYDDENLRRVLPAMTALAARRALTVSGLRGDAAYRIEELQRPTRSLRERLGKLLRRGRPARDAVQRLALADLIALNDLLGNWDDWMERRATVQARRRRPDAEILPLFLRPLWCIEDERGYRDLHAGVARFFGIDDMFEGLTSMQKDPPR
jgi:GT2 family glycosyltransferase